MRAVRRARSAGTTDVVPNEDSCEELSLPSGVWAPLLPSMVWNHLF